MQFGELADYFEGVGAKRLSSHEVDPKVSRGHEFQGVDPFRRFIGTPSEKIRIPVTFFWLDDAEQISVQSDATWYDSRAGQAHRSAEYRLYYLRSAEEVVYRAKDGDTLFLARTRDGQLLAIICPQGSASETQLGWLLGVTPDGNEIEPLFIEKGSSQQLSFFSSYILERLGITPSEHKAEDELQKIVLKKFKGTFPRTAALSALAQSLVTDEGLSPDELLVAWLEMEEGLFRALESHIVGEKLKDGFLTETGLPDVDHFVSFSLSVQNRRKSRAGLAFENHLKTLFDQQEITFSTQSFTEGRKRPDFLFPGGEAYHDPSFPSERLTMLGAKSSCKERWRQVLSEGARIPTKHLATLEPGISHFQLEEMQSSDLVLVVPQPIQQTYPQACRNELLSLQNFIDHVRTLDA